MFKIITLVPAILVAIIITVITLLYLNSRSEVTKLNSAVAALKSEISETKALLNDSRNKISELESNAQQIEALSVIPAPTIIPKQALITQQAEADIIQDPTPTLPSEAAKNSVITKVNSIAKFIPLSESQRERLTDKFMIELTPGHAPTESLEDIIGKENADFYREQRKNAFERVLNESIEKEIIYISRKLSLQPAQEELFRKTYFEIEDEIRKSRTEQGQQEGTQQSTLEKLVLEEKMRNQLLAERMKLVLDASQYENFLKYQSGTQDMQLWHE